MNHSGGGGYYQYDHNFNIMATDHGTGDSEYGSFRTYTTAASEFYEASNSHTSTVTDTAASSHASWYVAHTCMTGYLGHMSHSSGGSGAGNLGGWCVAGRDNGVGVKFRLFIFQSMPLHRTYLKP